ncbi:unnamed protein product [Discosporangium mesarthrocarpum]
MKVIRSLAKASDGHGLDLRRPFQAFDSDANGVVTLKEFGSALRQLGARLDDKRLRALFRHFDPNKSGRVNYGEFLWSFFNRRKILAQWREVRQGKGPRVLASTFHQGDTSGNGQLSLKEFSSVLEALSIHLEGWEVKTLAEQFDHNGDGQINIREFFTFMASEDRAAESSPRTDQPAPVRDSIIPLKDSQDPKFGKGMKKGERNHLAAEVTGGKGWGRGFKPAVVHGRQSGLFPPTQLGDRGSGARRVAGVLKNEVLGASLGSVGSQKEALQILDQMLEEQAKMEDFLRKELSLQ